MISEALATAGPDAQASRIVPPHPATTSRAYLLMRRWHLGRGRLSGYFVLPLLIGAIPIFVLFTVEELCIGRLCIPIEGTHLGTIVFRLFWNAYFLFLLFCLTGAIVRFAMRRRLRRRKRRLDQVRPPPPAEGNARAEMATARQLLSEAEARILDPLQHEPQLRAAVHAYLALAIILGLLLIVNMQDSTRLFAEEGYLGGKAAFPSLVTIALAVFALRFLHVARNLRRGASELYEEAEALIDQRRATLARLLRGEEAQGLPISFRRYGANPAPSTKS